MSFFNSKNAGILGARGPAVIARALCSEVGSLSRSQRKRRKNEARRAEQEDHDPLAPPPSPESFPPWRERDFFRYELVHASRKPGSRARVGRIHTPHGIIDTPNYVPVATQAALKAVNHTEVDEALDLQLMFCNTYHLLLQPGPETVAAAGGLHRFMGRSRNRPLITDSGGFQVFSMDFGGIQEEKVGRGGGESRRRGQVYSSNLLEVSEEGVKFRSYRDGRHVLLTPESSVETQKALGADIIIPLDELLPAGASRERLEESLALTHRWEARSLMKHLSDVREQAMYGVVHGGGPETLDLRQKSIDYLTALPFDGFAIGGAVGFREDMEALLQYVLPRLPVDRPNHLLGIADIESVELALPLGVDTFDSCYPTRIGRHGTLLVKKSPSTDGPSVERVNARSSKWARVFEPPDPTCPCPLCTKHSMAYLNHLIRAKEPLAGTLATVHNLATMSSVMAECREKILNDEI